MRALTLLIAAAWLAQLLHGGALPPADATMTVAGSDVGVHAADDPSAIANDNRTPAGMRVGDTLVLRLTLAPVVWRIYGDRDPGFKSLAFAEEGQTATIPGPLVRVRVGTPIHLVIRNPLNDTLVLRGLSARRSAHDSLVVLPNGRAEVVFVANRAGTYMYWGAIASAQRELTPTNRNEGIYRSRFDSQLAGAFVVDPTGAVPNDRILVISEFSDQLPPVKRDRHRLVGREFVALNGRSWPHTERLSYGIGDTVRWRIINTSFQAHPMHLHGFYFRVDSHGNATTGVDSIYTRAQRRMAVTEVLRIGETASITWSPDRPGGWIFHCHLTQHAAKLPPVDHPEVTDYPAVHDHGDPDHHVMTGMNGLVVGITVTGRAASRSQWHAEKRLRLFVQSDSLPGDSLRRFGYVLQRGAEPIRDSLERPGPVLVLTRGERTSIEVVNRATEPTAVHWHGIELESYYDGAAGWSGTPTRTSPAIRPDSTFEVRITPKRAGTFMYHTHLDEIRQQYGGLVGALLVLEPGQRWDRARDLLFLLSEADDGSLLVNGSATPSPIELRVGTTYRFRIADVAVYRQSLFSRIVRDSSLLAWRPVAKDGFDLPGSQATMRPSTERVASGETADFAFTPDHAGTLRLEFGSTTRLLVTQLQNVVPLRVVAK